MYEVFKPKSKILKKHIVSFSILKNDIDFEHINYFVFPQTGTTLGLLHNAKIHFDISTIQFENQSSNNFIVLLFGKYLLPLYLQYKSYIPEIGINFTPLGFNYFFDDAFIKYAPQNFQVLNYQSWNNITNELHQQNSDQDRISLLESFLESQFRNKELPKLERAASYIENETYSKINEIAEVLEISERSLNRKFKTYIGCTPTAFRKICRFRNTIDDKFKSGEQFNLTELGLNNNFYDSPHFTKEFKKLTHKNPRDFFSEVINVGQDNYPYIFS